MQMLGMSLAIRSPYVGRNFRSGLQVFSNTTARPVMVIAIIYTKDFCLFCFSFSLDSLRKFLEWSFLLDQLDAIMSHQRNLQKTIDNHLVIHVSMGK